MAERLKQLFETAADLPTAQRGVFLAETCRGDDALRDRLLALLAAHDDAGDFLEHPAALVEAIAADGEVDDEFAPGDSFAHFELLERLGAGGFGSVWRARQAEPVAREVALKVLHASGDAQQLAERFRAERQNLARMRHPGIAKVFDAGVTPAGRSWMAMELVDGEPLVRFCDARGLGTAARLRLFVLVCRAVQHAHSKGVVHRDLKPANVLVVERDGAEQPVVVDFGVAWSLGDAPATTTPGTPEYMSPEQAAADRAAVDTGTDVYALGVLLYELIARARPFERPPGLQGVDELLRLIRAGAAAPPRSLPTALRGLPIELDWIVAKAMAIDPAGRYASAATLADDVERVLQHEPVSVAPRSLGYRLRKLARRHRLVVGAATAVFVTAVAGTAVAVRGWMAASDAERTAVLAEQRARDDQQQAERASLRAQRALDLLDDLWESADPSRFGRADYPVRELFADFERVLPSRVAGEPEVEYRVRLSLARLQRCVGSLDRAQAHAERAVEVAVAGGVPERMAAALVELARVRFDAGAIDAAAQAVARGLPLVDAAVQPLLAAQLLEVHANCLLRSDAPQAAVQAAERALELRRASGSTVELARSAMQLANLHGSQGRVDRALEYLGDSRRVFEQLGNAPDALVALQHEAFLLQRRGDFAAAEERLRECLQGRRELLGDDHAQTAWAQIDLGWLLHERGRDADAEPLLRAGLAALRARLGQDHLGISEAMQRLGTILTETGAVDEAEQLLAAAAQRFRTSPGHPVDGLVACLGNLAGLQWNKGDRDAALQTQAQALSIAREQLPEDHFVLSVSMTNLAWMHSESGQPQQAVALLREALQRSSAAGRAGEAATQRTRLVQMLRRLGREQEADEVAGQAAKGTAKGK